jgi:hypothetical protein
MMAPNTAGGERRFTTRLATEEAVERSVSRVTSRGNAVTQRFFPEYPAVSGRVSPPVFVLRTSGPWLTLLEIHGRFHEAEKGTEISTRVVIDPFTWWGALAMPFGALLWFIAMPLLGHRQPSTEFDFLWRCLVAGSAGVVIASLAIAVERRRRRELALLLARDPVKTIMRRLFAAVEVESTTDIAKDGGRVRASRRRQASFRRTGRPAARLPGTRSRSQAGPAGNQGHGAS